MGRRQYSRTEISHQTDFIWKNRRYAGCVIQNFSRGGLYLTWGESTLALAMQEGYFKQGDRQRASVELGKGMPSANVEVVYVNRSGCGMAFVGDSDAIFAYFERLKRDSDVEKAPLPPIGGGSAVPAQSLIRHLRDRTRDFLQSHIKEFTAIAQEDLIALTDRTSTVGEQADLFFAVTTLESHSQDIAQALLAGVESGFGTLMASEGAPPSETIQTEMEQAELELLDKEVLDDWVFLEGLAHRAESRLAQVLYELNCALSQLTKRPVKHESNPLSPIALLLQVKQALQQYDFIPQAKHIVYRAFARTVLQRIHQLYAEVKEDLQKDGIDQCEIEVDKGEVIPQEPETGAMQPQPGTYLENLSMLMGLTGDDGVTQDDQRTAHPIASREQLIEGLDSVQAQRGILEQLEGHLRQPDAQSLSLDPTTRQAIAVSEKLVGTLQQDEFFTEGLQNLLDRLRIPFIKESILDPSILENTQHPGRRFLQALEQLAPYIDAVDLMEGKSRAGNLNVRGLIEEVNSGSIGSLQDVTRRIETLHGQKREHFARNSRLAIESCSRQERLWHAQVFVKRMLSEKLLGKKVSIALDRLFQYGWANLLIQTALLQGENSSQCRTYLRVLDLLVKLFPGQKPSKRLSEDRATELLKVIGKGFDAYPVYPEGTRGFINELRPALIEEGDSARHFRDNRVTIDENYLNSLFQGLAVEPEDSGHQTVEHKWLDLVAGLAPGDWVFQHAPDSDSRLINLVWLDAQLGKYLLVDGNGMKVFYGTAANVAQQFAENRMELPEKREAAVVDRAMQHILEDGYDQVQRQTGDDELTGLINRRSFERLLAETFRGEVMPDERHTVIMLDVDQFGLINDLYGFNGGDTLLQSIANLLRSEMPENAHLARTGDDEFSILLEKSSLEQGYQLAEQHRLAIHTSQHAWNNQSMPISVSVGVINVDNREQTPAELLKAASSACGIAKQAGRNCTRIYRETDREFKAHRELIDSVATIEDAMQKGKLVLVAQPIAPLQPEEGELHYEILLRVQGDDGRLMSPVHFILAAERYNLMRSVDQWVVDRFFSMLNEYQADLAGTDGFSVNLSSQSMDPEFLSSLLKLIENSPIERHKLGFEITETAMITDSQEAANFIREIRESGCSFYLDDFGSGYASFSYLKEMPVDYVKIDGIFIRDLLTDKTSLEMVKAITGISHFMHKKVIAEFVEDQATADLLRQIGVDYIQGYHIGRPVPLSEILAKKPQAMTG